MKPLLVPLLILVVKNAYTRSIVSLDGFPASCTLVMVDGIRRLTEQDSGNRNNKIN